MSSLKHVDRIKLEKLFGMQMGYVCGFSDRTFGDFVMENTGIDVYTDKYKQGGTSKANRLRTFWKIESDELTAKLLEALLEYWRATQLVSGKDTQLNEHNLYLEGLKIVKKMEGEDKFSSEVKTSKIKQNNIFNVNSSQFHFGDGDNVRNEKPKADDNVLRSSDIPVWVKWLVAIATIFGIMWGIFIYFNPNINEIVVNPISDKEGDVATTTISLLDIYEKAFTYDILVDRQEFFGKYVDSKIYGDGIVIEISSLSDRYILEIDIGRSSVICPQEKTEDFERLYPLLKDKKVRFYGIFTYSNYFGYDSNALAIDECSFERK